MSEANYLLSTFRETEFLRQLNPVAWRALINQARCAGLVPQLHGILRDRGLLDRLPARTRTHLSAARIVADNQDRVLLWEVNRIERAFKGLALPFVLLKGAAYLLLELPFARGRMSSDIDILVPKHRLGDAERALLDWGWVPTKLEDYDQYFYRCYSHELPPLRHVQRGTIVDVHHTLLPPTGRLHPNPEKLIRASVEVPGTRLRALAPVDMVLHSAAHAFQDGDLKAGLRDLIDLDGLFRHFGSDPDFWKELLPRACDIELSRPLYYGLRYAKRVLRTPIPDPVLEQSEQYAPPRIAKGIMDRLVDRVLEPRPMRGEGFTGGFSVGLLYVRAHWLRMPPWLLIRHLVRQAFRRSRRRREPN